MDTQNLVKNSKKNKRYWANIKVDYLIDFDSVSDVN